MNGVLILVWVVALWALTLVLALVGLAIYRRRRKVASASPAAPASNPTSVASARPAVDVVPSPVRAPLDPVLSAPATAATTPAATTRAATTPAATTPAATTPTVPPTGTEPTVAAPQPASAPDADALALRRAREAAEAELRAIREDISAQRLDLERREHRLTEREERLDAESRHLQARARELADHHAELDSRQAELNARREELADLERERTLVLERTAGLTAEEARAELVATIENQAKRDAALLARDIEREAQADGELRARRIITGAIQRLATEQTTESVVSVMHLPSDDMKGRIIGREGRNIRTFESVTGVNLIIDDTPEAVLLSCFDPVRREVGRIALEALVLDGRIHPQRIEDAYERARAEVEALCRRAGEDALVDVGITEMHPDLVAMLGRLRYRTSYGQNVLKHLLESAHIAGMMASELGLDPALMRRCALLHDIGKGLTHEVEGSHAIIGAELARRYGENDDVVHAIEAHHNEVEPRTLEAVLTQAADAISGGRPGARRESLEAYVKRLERLEEIATSYEGVEKVFAMQAGREVRVMVLPDAVDDIQAQVIAREIAKQVEHELTYPGQIRVTVVRESRATEVAR
ncbi:MAG: ribonuclease Y [Actinomycetes bacterium]